MGIGVATVVVLTVILSLNETPPIMHMEKVENIGMCFAMARELVAHAEAGILRERGGKFSATCRVEVPSSVTH